MSEDTRSDDFPDIAANPQHWSEVWMPWMSFNGCQDEIRLARYHQHRLVLVDLVAQTVGPFWRLRPTASKSLAVASWPIPVANRYNEATLHATGVILQVLAPLGVYAIAAAQPQSVAPEHLELF